MRRSVRIAAKVNYAAIIVTLLCTLGLAVAGLFHIFRPAFGFRVEALTSILYTVLGISLFVMLVSGFHIAVSDALQRMEYRDRQLKDRDPEV
jgi:hypothetical protein